MNARYAGPAALSRAARASFLGLLVLLLADTPFQALVPGWNAPRPGTFSRLSERELSHLQEGDVLLQIGMGVVPETIVWALGEPVGFSHAAVLFRRGERWFVVHSVNSVLSGRAEGVHSLAIEELLRSTRPNSLVVVRPNLTEDQRGRFLEVVFEHSRRGTPFDNRYSWEDDAELYCSELVLKALLEAGMTGLANRLEFRGPVVAFANFLDPNFFTPVLSQRADWPNSDLAHTR